MIKLKQILSEKFYDVVKSVGKDKGDWIDITKNPVNKKIEDDFPIKQNIFDLVDFAYRKHLGKPHVGVTRPEDVMGPEYQYWEAIDINDSPDADAVIFGKKKHGIKVSGIGHNGEKMAKEEVIKHLLEILKNPGYWIEASHPVASILKRNGARIFDDSQKIESMFPDSKFTKWFDDNSYIRTIDNIKRDSTAREYIFGRPQI